MKDKKKLTKSKIIHLDMDSFFASAELSRNPQWRNFPVVVGSSIGNRGIVTTANYVARSFGIGSATPMFKAKKLCENLVVIPSDMEFYKEVSRKIAEILQEFCILEKIDFISIDEAFLDISYKNLSDADAIKLMRQIRAVIFAKTGLTSSAGLAGNKILAKIASEQNKPDGEFWILKENQQDFINSLELKKISGVGKKLVEKLDALNVKTCSDLLNCEVLTKNPDKFLTKLIAFAKGENLDFSQKKSSRKSISIEKTFLQNILSLKEAEKIIEELFIELHIRKAKLGDIKTSGIFVKLKFANYKQISREKATNSTQIDGFLEILTGAWTQAPLRLLGIGYKIE